MTNTLIQKRLVYHVGGYDLMPPEVMHRRFTRELRRFETTWSVAAQASPPAISPDAASWTVSSEGPNWRVETDYRAVRWDDVIAAEGHQPMWRRIPRGLVAFADFVASGALLGYLRSNWRYAAFFLYPYLLFALLAALAVLAGRGAAELSGSTALGLVAGLGAFVALIYGPGRWCYLPHLFDDWIFARDYVRRPDPVLDGRLDRLAAEIAAAARQRQADEIVVVGHSLGAVLAVDLLDRALRLDPNFGRTCPVILLTVGSSILKLGFHRGAKRLREAMARVAQAPQLFWGEYQALTDVMNFYKSDPVAALGLAGRGPLVRVVRISRMLQPATYRRFRRNFFRVHCQFVSANDLRAAYDYFMTVCGPLPAETLVRSESGAVAAMGPDGALVTPPLDMTPAPEVSRRVGARAARS
jgi:hypothetical protein